MEKIIKIGNYNYFTEDFLGIPYYMTIQDRNMKDFEDLNYKSLLSELGLNYKSISLTDQTHGNHVEIVNRDFKKYKETDGLIGGEGDALIIKTADCLPVAIFDTCHKKLALVHSGWRGTLNKISEVAILKMQENYETHAQDLRVYVGPGISKDSFEVEDDVIEILRRNFKNIEGVYEQITDKKYLLDIKEVLYRNLLSMGIEDKNIFISKCCTFKEDIFHSYRREGSKNYGTMATIAMVMR